MPAVHAERLCPDAICVPPDFTRYRAVSNLVRGIFKRHTDLVEPLSLDEAYLDVTENKIGLPTATRVTRAPFVNKSARIESEQHQQECLWQFTGRDDRCNRIDVAQVITAFTAEGTFEVLRATAVTSWPRW